MHSGFKTIDELVEYCKQTSSSYHMACLRTVTHHSYTLINILESKTNNQSKFDLMLIQSIISSTEETFKYHDKTLTQNHKRILELYKDRI